MAVLLARESKLFEFRAIGGKVYDLLLNYLCHFLFLFMNVCLSLSNQVEVSVRGSDMFIGTVLKSLEIEDLVSRSGSNESCYLARSFIQSSVVLPSFKDAEIKNPEGNDLSSSEGEEKFYEAPEILVDSVDYTSLRTPSFSRMDGLLPVDNRNITMPSSERIESLDSFVKAQIVIYHQTSPQYNNIDNQVKKFLFIHLSVRRC